MGDKVSIEIQKVFTHSVAKANADFTFRLEECVNPEEAVAYLIGLGLSSRLNDCTAGISKDDPDCEGLARVAVAESLGKIHAGMASLRGAARLDPGLKMIRDTVASALKIKPTQIKTWEDLAGLVGEEKAKALQERARAMVAAQAKLGELI